MTSKHGIQKPTLLEQAMLLAGATIFIIGFIHFSQLQQLSIITPNDYPKDSAPLSDVGSTVTVAQVLRDKGTLLIDARDSQDYNNGHINGAVSIPESQFEEQVAGILPLLAASSRTVVYCGSSQCGLAEQEVQMLRDMGLENVSTLEGGYEAWKVAVGQPKPTSAENSKADVPVAKSVL